MNFFRTAMMSVCLAVVACAKAPAPAKDFPLDKLGLATITLPGNSLCDFEDEEYEVSLNDGVIGIRDNNSSFDLSQDPKEGKEIYELTERLNNPAEKAAAEAFMKEGKWPRTVVEVFNFSNGFKGFTYRMSKGTKYYTFAMKRGETYYLVEMTGTSDTEIDFFDQVKAGVESIK